ncbi:GDP-D-glucose phosphorylase 1-like [Stylophora pistillata]|uniref:GDP-D-glucose phosphorylase 1-like n=1 Tax=Stylophora pistillata TaxID=50429 RepID=UPI000C0495D3|nr:GDP-D-glucose phosphorylase 1-like [Stylophora pistillata]
MLHWRLVLLHTNCIMWRERIVPGRYGVFVQLNEMRFNKRRKPELINSISQTFNPDKFNFTKVHRKEVLFALCPKHFPRKSTVDDDDEQHLLLINVSPMEYGHCLLIPSVLSCLPQVLTEEALVLALETSMLSNHR